MPEPAGPAQGQGFLRDHSFLLVWPCCLEAWRRCSHVALAGQSGVPSRSLSACSDLPCMLPVCWLEIQPACWAVEVTRGYLASDQKADRGVEFSVWAIQFRSANQQPFHFRLWGSSPVWKTAKRLNGQSQWSIPGWLQGAAYNFCMILMFRGQVL